MICVRNRPRATTEATAIGIVSADPEKRATTGATAIIAAP